MGNKTAPTTLFQMSIFKMPLSPIVMVGMKEADSEMGVMTRRR